MSAGNALYAGGDYAAAADAYRWLEAAGLRHPALELNLGSACLSAGDRGCAVLALERAHRLAPRDADIRRVRSVAASSSDDAGSASDWNWGRGLISFAELQLAILSAWCLVWMAWLLGQHRPGTAADIGLGLAGLLLAGGLVLLGGRVAAERFRPEAVVTAESPQSLTEAPGPVAPEAAGSRVDPGSRVHLLELRDGYARVRPMGRSFEGWLPAPALQTVDLP
ncbi:MAG: hypothetical protein KDH92_13020 [Chloroflexi bacterium]|nr:hypothetical protein [Chloroflexota bacterium]